MDKTIVVMEVIVNVIMSVCKELKEWLSESIDSILIQTHKF